MANPFDEDCAAHEVAQSLGDFEVIRRTSRVEVDRFKLDRDWMHLTPNYQKIRDAIERGQQVPGARLVESTEYVLRKRENARQEDR